MATISSGLYLFLGIIGPPQGYNPYFESDHFSGGGSIVGDRYRAQKYVVTRDGEQDLMVLKAEGPADENLQNRVMEALQGATKLKGAVDLVPPKSLPNDGRVIADERVYE